MQSIEYVFEPKQKEYWIGKIHGIVNCLDKVRQQQNLKGFQVQIGNIKRDKTPKQLRGIHRLFNVISLAMRERGYLAWDPAVVKEHVKIQCGYVQKLQGIIVTKSLKKASSRQATEMIEHTLAWANGELKIPCSLTSQDQRDFEDYFMKR